MAATIAPNTKVIDWTGRAREVVILLRFEGDQAVLISPTLAGWKGWGDTDWSYRVPASKVELYREVRRDWKHGGNPQTKTWTRVHVSTVHPELGELDRGVMIRQGAGWRLHDHEGFDLGLHAGDYIDVERVLLEATTGQDEVVPADKLADWLAEDEEG